MATTTCAAGVYDCALKPSSVSQCAAYNGDFVDPQGNVWIVIVGFAFMALMSFGIGANDAANSWGTSVGSKAISVRWACILGGLADWAGAVLLGHGVSSTIQKGVSEVQDQDCWACGRCNSLMTLYAAGMLASIVGASLFLMLASYSGMPVSTTHAIVGGVVGMSLFAVGGSCLNWDFQSGLAGIVASWLISPLLSGLIGVAIYYTTNWLIMDSKSPRENAIIFMPFIYGVTIFILLMMIFLKSKQTGDWTLSQELIVSFGAALVLSTFIFVFFVPYIRNRMPSNSTSYDDGSKHSTLSFVSDEDDTDQKRIDVTPIVDLSNSNFQSHENDSFSMLSSLSSEYTNADRASMLMDVEESQLTLDQKDAMFVFKYLLILVAVLESFAHGANDTGNATAAFSAIYVIHRDGLNSCSSLGTPMWIMAVAGFFVFLGINVLGYRVMKTLGSSISFVNVHRGFCMEIASTLTVVIATILRFPVSTTHCQIGAVVMVSMAAFGKKNISFGVVGKIAISWLVTMPFAGFTAAVTLLLLKSVLTS